MPQTPTTDDWSFACHLTYPEHGAVTVLRHTNGVTAVTALRELPASGLEIGRRPVFVGVTETVQALLMDPASKVITPSEGVPRDAFPAYAYVDQASDTYCMVFDGDKETGADPVQCDNNSAPVIFLGADAARGAKVDKMLCLGRGHHVVAYSAPSNAVPNTPRRAYVTNLLDGTLMVIGNDPADSASYLQVLDTLNLCEPEKEKQPDTDVPNNAFPHGMVYSPITGKLYNLNNGYGSVVIVDPLTNTIEGRHAMPMSSNLLLSPDGRYLIGKGVDRKSDPEHLIGRLTVMDAASGETVALVDLPDVYPSVYRFSPDGRKLYLTTAATGKGAQRDHANLNTLLVFDTTNLPAIRLIKEVTVGVADCGRRPIAFAARAQGAPWLFVPNPSDGTLSILDGNTDTVTETVAISNQAIAEVNFCYWGRPIFGA